MHRICCLGLLTLSLCGGTPAPKPTRQQWKLADFMWVKRSPREAGSPENGHPVKVDLERLREALAGIRLEDPKEALFAAEELGFLVKPIQEALSLAEPGEDLLLLSTHRRGGSFLNTPYGLTARIFVVEGRLNLIVHDARLDFMDRYRGSQVLPTFVFGSRNAVAALTLNAPGAKLHRQDWLSFNLAEAPPQAAVPAAKAPEPQAPRPFAEQEERLRALKRLREENLITEDEYQKKREEVLRKL